MIAKVSSEQKANLRRLVRESYRLCDDADNARIDEEWKKCRVFCESAIASLEIAVRELNDILADKARTSIPDVLPEKPILYSWRILDATGKVVMTNPLEPFESPVIAKAIGDRVIVTDGKNKKREDGTYIEAPLAPYKVETFEISEVQ